MTEYTRIGLEATESTMTTGHQTAPSVAAFAGGGFILVWQTADTAQDGSGSAIKYQRFDSAGAKIGGEVLVNTSATGNQTAPTVTTLAGGGFVIAWQTADAAQDGSGSAIKAQVYDSSGATVGGEFCLNSQLSGNQSLPAITSLASGGFVATWQTDDAAQDGVGSAVKGQMYDAAGAAVGGEFLVNQSAFGSESRANVSSLSNGGFIATWTTGSGTSADVYAQVFNAAGVKVGTQFIVNTATAFNQDNACVSQISGGRFVVTWSSAGSLTTGDTQIRAQVFNNDGSRVGAEFQVNTSTSDPNSGAPITSTSPQVDDLPDGGFLITWSHSGGSYPTTNIRGQQYDASGAAVGGEFTVNTVSNRTETTSDMAVDGNGNVFVAWASADGSLTNYDIRGQVFSVHAGPAITSNGGGNVAAVSAAENQTAVAVIAATNPNAAPGVTYAIVGGLDAARFTINATTGALSFVSNPNFESKTDFGANGVYDVVVAASDGTYYDLQTLAVTVTNVNEGQTFNSPVTSYSWSSNASGVQITLGENAVGTVATFTAADIDGDTLSYSLTGADAARFAIDAVTGALTFISAPNYEAPLDAGADNIYNVTVVASDGSISTTRAVAITVSNVNEAPVITSGGGGASAALTVGENTSLVATFTAIDPENNPRTWSIIGGADAARFSIASAYGELYLVGGANFEAPTDSNGDNVYEVIVQVSDGWGNVDTQTLAITVGNVNEAPVITSGAGGTAAAVSVSENGTAVTVITSTDPDGGARTYAISGGADAAQFTIDAATGALAFVALPDYEMPGDADGNNVYQVIVTASDGTLVDTQTISVTVGNANDAPTITSGGGGESASIGVDEGETAVAVVAASDQDGSAVTYAITAGADAALFSIDAATGVLTFISAPDFETPTDTDGDNLYQVVVTASDGTLSDSQAIALAVGDTNEMPTITSPASFSLAENALAVGTVLASDPDGDALSFAIIGGADAAFFAIDAESGALSFVAAPDYDVPGDADSDNVYDVTVRASDGSLTAIQAVSVTVSDVNEAPVLTSQTLFSVSENSAAVGMIAASDPDGDTLSFTITGGADAALFSIDAQTGALSFINAPDFEAPADSDADNLYDVIITASDGTLEASQLLSVAVGGVNEAPLITSNGGGATAAVTLNENGSAVTTVVAGDPENGTVTYSIVGGSDAARFTINAGTGVLSFVASPNWEAPTDADANNVYDVLVQASDGSLIDTQVLAVTVANVVDGVTLTGTSKANTLTGGTAEDTISGLGGSDVLSGLGGGDAINGDYGNDTINGGAGADVLTGGAGADTFVYQALSDSSLTLTDLLTDFTVSQNDKISLSAIDANANIAGDQAFAWIGTGAFTGTAGQLRYYQSGGDTYVTGDVNGDSAGDFLIRIDPLLSLVATSFVL